MSLLQSAAPLEKAPKAKDERSPLMAFVTDSASETVLRDCLPRLGINSSSIMRGGIGQAVAHLRTERSPQILVVDIADAAMPTSEIHRLAEVCEPGVSVIAVGTRNDIGLYRDLVQAGVSDYIVKPLTAQLVAKSLKHAIRPSDATPISQKVGKLVAFIGARGGVGASTVAANMAWHLANREHRRVALVDLDLHSGDCALMLNVRPTGGLRDALDNPMRVDNTFLGRATIVHGERLHLLSSQEQLGEALNFAPDAIDTLISALRLEYHYVIVDLPGTYMALHRHVLQVADERILVADQTLRAVRDAARLRVLLGEDDPDHQTLLVVNRSGEGGSGAITLAEMNKTLGIRPSCVIPFLPKLFTAAATQAAMPTARRGGFAEAMDALALAISGRAPKRRSWWGRK